MANVEQLALLRRDVDGWNAWRQEHAEAVPELEGADLSGADLALADLAGAHLSGARLVLANLRGADLRRADLSGANLVGARLLGVDLEGADVRGADLSTAEDITSEQISETRGDETTVLPPSLARPRRWLVKKVSLAAAFAAFSDYWNPRIVADVNTAQIKVVKLHGPFVWHHHELEDELFLVRKGRLIMRFRDTEVAVEEGEFIVVPHGVEHQPYAEQECEVVLVEPGTTLNTGNVRNERTVERLERL